MAQLSSFLIPQSDVGGNLSQGFEQGVQSGMDWAHNQASLDVQRAQVQNQIDQTKAYQTEVNAKVGQQYFSQLNNIAAMDNKSPLKKANADIVMGQLQKLGYVDDDNAKLWQAALFSPETQAAISKLNNAYSNVRDPQFLKNLSASFSQFMGTPPSVTGLNDLAEKIVGANAMISAAQTRNDATESRFQRRQGQQLQLAGQKDYENLRKNVDFSLNGISRAMSLLDDPEIASNKQLRTIIASEEARLVTQKSNFGEGTSESMGVNTAITRLGDLKEKLANAPQNTLSDAYKNQARKIYQDLMKENMAAHDRAVNTATPDSVPNAQRQQILGRATAYQKQMAKRFQKYGGWLGDGIEGVAKPDGSQGSQNSDAAAPSPGGKSASNNGQPDAQANLKSALRFKQILDSRKDLEPAQRADAIARAKDKYGPDALAKVGLQ